MLYKIVAVVLTMVVSSLSVLLVLCFDVTFAFKAAVYEHNVTFPKDRTKVLSRAQALDVVKDNLQVYSTQCKEAAKQGSKIIVFPEYGIYGIGWTRQSITPYLEFVPDPSTEKWNPCDNSTKHNDTDVQHILSCYAKSNNLYIVANIGASQPCIPPDSGCPADGHFQFSTNVVYDSNGTFIARYFKQNLDSQEIHFDRPSIVNYTVFTTPFGRFGTISTQDILYHDPAVTMIEKMNITNIVYTSAWKDQLPLMAAIEFHSAYSEGMHINLLAANLHLPVYGYHGSGMYWPFGTSNDGVFYYNDSLVSPGKLLVHDINPLSEHLNSKRISEQTNYMIDHRLKTNKTKSNDKHIEGSKWLDLALKGSHREKHEERDGILLSFNNNFDNDTFWAVVNNDRFKMKPSRKAYGDITVCDGTLCCSTGFEGLNQAGELYAVGAFDGLHTVGAHYRLQACIYIRCAGTEVQSCGQPTKAASSYMSKMSFSGNFSSKYVFPEVLTTDGGTLDIVQRTWLYQEAIIIDVGVFGSPLSISMIAIDFKHDQQ